MLIRLYNRITNPCVVAPYTPLYSRRLHIILVAHILGQFRQRSNNNDLTPQQKFVYYTHL